MDKKLKNNLTKEFSQVNDISDISPESSSGRFEVSTENLSEFTETIDIRFMDYGVDIKFAFSETDTELVPKEGVKHSQLYDIIDQMTEEVPVSEARNIKSPDGVLSRIRRGPNHDHSGEYDVYPGDTIIKEPLPKGRLYGSYTGCDKMELLSKRDILVDRNRLASNSTDPSAIEVIKRLDLFEPTFSTVNWIQDFCSSTLNWDSHNVTEVWVKTFTDSTVVCITLTL